MQRTMITNKEKEHIKHIQSGSVHGYVYEHANKDQDRFYHTCSIVRFYSDEKGEVQSTKTWRDADLLHVAHVATKLHEFLTKGK